MVFWSSMMDNRHLVYNSLLMLMMSRCRVVHSGRMMLYCSSVSLRYGMMHNRNIMDNWSMMLSGYVMLT